MIHQQYPDVFGMACKLKVLEPLRILSDGGSWSLYELYAALVTGPHAQHTEREMARLQAELEQAEQARRRWWHRWLKR
jgi:hypothetical protein